jgi:probable phosphoglycerate mutase
VYRQERFSPPPGATELLLVRHGESEALEEGASFALLDGQGDPALSPEGQEQAALVSERLAAEPLDAVYISTLRRTAETADPLVRLLGITPVVEPGLREIFLGEWEGGTFRERVADRHELAVRLFAEQRWDVIPGAEPSESFSERVADAVARIAAAHPDQRVVAFTHGGVIAETLAQATGSQRFAFLGADNASISHLVITDARWILRRFNDTAHLHVGLTTRPEPLT